MSKKDNDISVPLLAFTFFYAFSLYSLLLGFYYWQRNKKDPEE